MALVAVGLARVAMTGAQQARHNRNHPRPGAACRSRSWDAVDVCAGPRG